MYKRVLLCIPAYSGIFGWPGVPHPGVGYLSEFLSRNDIKNTVIDMRLGYNVADLIRKAREFRADLIGVTLMTYKHEDEYMLINEIKKAGYAVVIGGPHVSTFKKKVLEECDADFAVKMEGEHTLLELCRGKPHAGIKSLIYRSGGKIIENECMGVENLEELPFPLYEKFELGKYMTKAIPIVSSRGCPYQCIYCSVKVTMGREFRHRSPENIFREIKHWHSLGYRHFLMFDDNFTLIKERVDKLCDLVVKSEMEDLVFACNNGVRADRVDHDLLVKMKNVGFRYLSFGVEAGTNRVLKVIKKGESMEDIEKSIKDACDMGFDVTLFFLIGSPTETRNDIMKSIRLSLKYGIKDVRFYNIIPFPETELFDWIRTNNYFLEEPHIYLNSECVWNNHPVFETPELPLKERERILKLTKMVRNKIRKRWFRKRIAKAGVLGKMAAPVLQYEFIRDPIMNSVLMKIGPVMPFARRFTERVFDS
jgi:anaerobic magnesium-protoporphyrin IX monomethyl ester cyclase